MLTAQEVYTNNVRSLPPSERLRLAALILEELTASAASLLDFSDSWSDEDVRDLTAFSLQHAAAAYPEEEELV